MGSVTIIFLIPIMIIIMLFGTAVGAIKGDNVTKVELPYNPSEGIVWEYDGVDDPLFDLVETEIDGDKQVFIFKGIPLKETGDLDTYMTMDAIFSNKNGEKLLYYARVNHDYLALNYKIEFWSPEEYVIFDYAPKEETTVEGAEWASWSRSSAAIQNGEEENEGETTFSYLVLPDKEDGSDFKLIFEYRTMLDEKSGRAIEYEKIELVVHAESEKCEIKDEDRFYYDSKTYQWVGHNPALCEE